MADPDFAIDEGEAWQPTEAKILGYLANREMVVPVVGAGISAIAGIPGNADLAAHLRKRFGQPHPDIGVWTDEEDPRQVAADIGHLNPDREEEVKVETAAFFQQAAVTIDPILTALVTGLPSKLIISLDYDPSLEEHARQAKVPHECLSGEPGLQKVQRMLIEGTVPDKVTILHLHGCERDSGTIVLAEGGYGSAAHNGRITSLINELQHRRTLCFLGTQLDEPYMLAALTTGVKVVGKRHVLFVPRSEVHKITGRGRPGPAQHGIEIVEMPHHHCTRGVIRHLTRTPPPPGSSPGPSGGGPSGGGETPTGGVGDGGEETAEHVPSTRPADSPTDTGDYVPTVITDCDPERDDGTTNYYAHLLGRRRRRLFADDSPDFLDEVDVVTERRALVLGMPGSGKSELLRYAATLVPEPERPVLIPLNAVSLAPADATTRLVRWARTQEAAPAVQAVTPGALQNDTFHFFLDGLDEVAPADQTRIAQQIVEVARAFPQHAFTVTARPVEANSIFASDEWRCLKIVPGSVWQLRYAERHGVDLGELLNELEGGRDLRDLLQLPFFLVRVIRMRGRIAGLDLWGVVRQLIDEALGREASSELLPVDPGLARIWLQDLALEMHLAGQTIVSVPEAESIPLPEGLEGNVREICERLVARVMLQPRAGGYVFPHRIIGEALAAEALDRREPIAELLDAIAPVVSPAISGVRADWRVPLAFLLPHNEQWRIAVRERDKLQWARSVPLNAEPEERREAATRIWQTYLDWKIWLWNYDLPDLIQDAGALGRLLPTEGLADIVEQVVLGLDHESPQVQGNAIRALALAGGMPGFEERLREILLDDEREPVVRRKAGIAASDRDYHDLLPVIVERCATTFEETEAQDLSIAAMRLARDDEVKEVALKLVENSGSHGTVLSRLDVRLSSLEVLRFLAAFAELDPDATPFVQDLVEENLEKVPDAEREAIAGEVVRLAVIWGIDNDLIREVIESHRAAAVEGLKRTLAMGGEGRWWRGSHIIWCFTADELETAGAGEQIVEIRRMQEARAAQPREPQTLDVQEEPEDERDRPPTLSDVLAQPPEESDGSLQYNCRYLAAQVTDLTEDERAELIQRLQAWWPDKPFPETIEYTPKGGGAASWRMDNGAAAWVWYGPPLDGPLTTKQWAEIAVSGILFEEQIGWLRRKATPEGVAHATTICDTAEGRVWSALLRAAPEPMAPELAAAVGERLRKIDNTYELREIALRLFEAGALEPLRQLADVSDEFRQVVQPQLAHLGDEPALSDALARLVKDLEAGEWPDSDDLFWLEGVRGKEEHLPALFHALTLAYRPEARETRRRAFADPVSPLLAVIREFSAELVVAGLDELLKLDGMEFLRLQREAVVQAELVKQGSAAARARLERARS